MNLAQKIVDVLIEADDDLRRITGKALPGLGTADFIKAQLKPRFGPVEIVSYGPGTDNERKRWPGRTVRRIVINIALPERVVREARNVPSRWRSREALLVKIRQEIQWNIQAIFRGNNLHITLVNITSLSGPPDKPGNPTNEGWKATVDISFAPLYK